MTVTNPGETERASNVDSEPQGLLHLDEFLGTPQGYENPPCDYDSLVKRLQLFLEGMSLKGDSYVLRLYHVSTDCENQTIKVRAQLPDDLLITVECSSYGATEREASFRLQRSSTKTSDWYIDPQLEHNKFEDSHARWFFCSIVLPAILANSRVVSDLEMDVLTNRQDQARAQAQAQAEAESRTGGTRTPIDEIFERYPDSEEPHPQVGGLAAAIVGLFRI